MGLDPSPPPLNTGPGICTAKYVGLHKHTHTYTQIDRWTEIDTDAQTDKVTHIDTERQTDRHTLDTQVPKCVQRNRAGKRSQSIYTFIYIHNDLYAYAMMYVRI